MIGEWHGIGSPALWTMPEPAGSASSASVWLYPHGCDTRCRNTSACMTRTQFLTAETIYSPPDFLHLLCFAHRAWTTRRSTSLRSSGLTFRHLAAPNPTAVRRSGGGDSLRLARSSISIARSKSASGGKPVRRTTARSRALRLEPIARESAGVSEWAELCCALVDIRMLV